MQKTANRSVAARPGRIPLSNKERLAIARRVRGSWKRPLKQTMRTLKTIRKGWDRKIG